MMKNPYQSPRAMWLGFRSVDPMADDGDEILATSTQGTIGGESGVFPIGGGG